MVGFADVLEVANQSDLETLLRAKQAMFSPTLRRCTPSITAELRYTLTN